MRQFIIPSKKGQELLIQYILKTNSIVPKKQQWYEPACASSLEDKIQPELINLNGVMFRHLQDTKFYDNNVQQALRCSVASIVSPSTDGISGAERFFHIFNKMKKIGEGMNSTAMSAGIQEKGRNLPSNTINLEDKKISRNGHFIELDDEGLIIGKFSKNEDSSGNQDILREMLIGQILNQLRKEIPNFVQTYGLVGCDRVFNDNFFCSAAGNTSVLIMEKVSGDSFGTWLKNAQDGIDNQVILFSSFFQILQAIWFGFERFQFAHNDLHADNILVRKLQNDFYLPYFYEEGAPIFLRTSMIPSIIDFGYSRTIIQVHKNVLDELMIAYYPSDLNLEGFVNVAIGTHSFDDYRGETGNFRSSYGPQQNNPLFDIFRIVSYCYKYVWEKPKLKMVLDTILKNFPVEYQITQGNYDAWAERYFSLSQNETEILVFAGVNINSIIKHFYAVFSSLFPTQVMEITNSSISLVSREIPIMACSLNLMQKIESNPVLSMNMKQLNIGCEASVHTVLKKLDLIHNSSEDKNIEDLILYYDYIMMHKDLDLKQMTPHDRYVLLNLVQLAEKQVKTFLSPSLYANFEKMKSELPKRPNDDIVENYLQVLEDCYKNRNIAAQNLNILWNLTTKGIILQPNREVEYINLMETVKAVSHQIKEVASDIVYYTHSEKVKERAQRLIF